MNILVIDNNFIGAYDSHRTILKEISAGFEKMGHRVCPGPGLEACKAVLKHKHISFSIGIGQYNSYVKGTPLYDKYGIVHYQWIIDNPLKMKMDNNSMFIKYIFIDEEFAALCTLKQPPLFLPLGYNISGGGGRINSDRKEGVLFAGRISNRDKIIGMIEKDADAEIIKKLTALCESDLNGSFIRNYLEIIGKERPLDPQNVFSLANSYIRLLKRIKVIESFQKTRVYICGNVADQGIMDKDNVTCQGLLSYEETDFIFEKFRYCLNISPNYSKCIHDRIMRGLNRNACVISDCKDYLYGIFGDSLLYYDYNKLAEIDDMVNGISDDQYKNNLIKSKKAVEKCRWDNLLSVIIDDYRKNFSYDILIVGAGIYGSVIAREMTDAGFKCLIVEKEQNPGGLLYDELKDNLYIQKFGPHIFHTNNRRVFEFLSSFTKFFNYTHHVKTYAQGKYHDWPLNRRTIELFSGKTSGGKDKRRALKNLEEKAINEIGETVYHIFIKDYTEKQWGLKAHQLPADLMKRMPVNETNDRRFFTDTYQGLPVKGYTQMLLNMIKGIDIRYCSDYNLNRPYYNGIANYVIYTGMIDELFDYCYGRLKYRTVRFENRRLNIKEYQPCGVCNYPEKEKKFLRITEHKYLQELSSDADYTIITEEYPEEFGNDHGQKPCYPYLTKDQIRLHKKYMKKLGKRDNIFIGGRLGLYKYIDMDMVVLYALDTADACKKNLKKRENNE